MCGRFRLFHAGSLVLLLGFGVAMPAFVLAQDNPMTAPQVEPAPAPDDESDAAPAVQPAYPAINAPAPPVRPGRRPVLQAASQSPAAPAEPPRQEAATDEAPPLPPASNGFSFRLPSFAVEPPKPPPQPAVAVPSYPPIDAPLPPVRPGARPAPKAEPPVASAPPSVPEPATPVISNWSSFGLRTDTPREPNASTTPEAEVEGEMEASPNPAMPTIGVPPQPSSIEEIEAEEAKTPEPMQVEKQTDAVNIACLQPGVLKYIRLAGEHFKGTPVITSGQRDRGRRGSYHRKCMAADFFIPGVERSVLARYLRSLPGAGGVGTYCHTKAVHVDTGEPRNWYQCGFRFRFALR